MFTLHRGLLCSAKPKIWFSVFNCVSLWLNKTRRKNVEVQALAVMGIELVQNPIVVHYFLTKFKYEMYPVGHVRQERPHSCKCSSSSLKLAFDFSSFYHSISDFQVYTVGYPWVPRTWRTLSSISGQLRPTAEQLMVICFSQTAVKLCISSPWLSRSDNMLLRTSKV